jgi:hypothetical protein
MPQCQFLFFAVFMFQKIYTCNILGIGRNKSQSSYLPDTKTESGGETETDQGAAAPNIALPPINSLQRENPKETNTFP